MSTTTKKETAFEYSGAKNQRGIVLEIEVSHVDQGASISIFSQYPGEAEILLQPLACIEATRAPRPPRSDPPDFRCPLSLSSISPMLDQPRSAHLDWRRSMASCASTARPTARSAPNPALPHPSIS